jgi:hypothetical protein
LDGVCVVCGVETALRTHENYEPGKTGKGTACFVSRRCVVFAYTHGLVCRVCHDFESICFILNPSLQVCTSRHILRIFGIT